MNNKIIDEQINKCQLAIKENNYLEAILLHDEIVDTYYKNNDRVLIKLSKHKFFLGLLDELDYINDLKILLPELIHLKNKLQFMDI